MRHLFFKFFLFVLMTLITSIITFSKKKQLKQKMLPSTLDMVPSTLDPRQKDRLSKIHQNFSASKYDTKQHSNAT